jgi:itaconate CoA-transferase
MHSDALMVLTSPLGSRHAPPEVGGWSPVFSAGAYAALYRDKLTTADEAVAAVTDGSLLVHAMGLSEPPALLWAFANRLRTGDLRRLRVFSGPATFSAMDTVLAVDLADRVERCSAFVGSADRGMVQVGLNYYVPNHFYQLPRLIAEHLEVDVVVTTVSPMDRAGFFTFGTSNDFISTVARAAKRLIVEVNEHMPRVHGDSRLHVSEVSAVVENHVPVPHMPQVEPSAAELSIARSIADLVPDGATIQLGIGTVPNAVCAFLSDHRDLGIHTELFGQGMVDLIRAGVVTGARKTLHPGKHVFTIAGGDQELLDFIHDNPAVESYPVSYTNHPTVIARNDNMVSINAVLEVDLLGQANAEVLGGRQFSGSGGQLDFVRGAFDAKGGKSILAFQSTTRNGTVSRIVPRLSDQSVITTPRNDTHLLATEFGVANLKGRSTRERALAIIELAHPAFRDDLLRAAEEMYLI